MICSKQFQAAVFQLWLCGSEYDDNDGEEIAVLVTAATCFELIFRLTALHCHEMLVSTP